MKFYLEKQVYCISGADQGIKKGGKLEQFSNLKYM